MHRDVISPEPEFPGHDPHQTPGGIPEPSDPPLPRPGVPMPEITNPEPEPGQPTVVPPGTPLIHIGQVLW